MTDPKLDMSGCEQCYNESLGDVDLVQPHTCEKTAPSKGDDEDECVECNGEGGTIDWNMKMGESCDACDGTGRRQ